MPLRVVRPCSDRKIDLCERLFVPAHVEVMDAQTGHVMWRQRVDLQGVLELRQCLAVASPNCQKMAVHVMSEPVPGIEFERSFERFLCCRVIPLEEYLKELLQIKVDSGIGEYTYLLPAKN